MNQKLIITLSQYSTIVLVGWWTGWHIQPIVSLTRHIKNTDIIPDFLWIGWSDSQEERAAKEVDIRFMPIPILKLATTRSLKILLYPFFLKLGFYKAWKILRWIQDKNLCVFSKGWPGSVAIGIAAWSLWIPLYIHESDTIPGRSNRILGKFATRIFLGFDCAKQYFNSSKCEIIGQILDPVFFIQPTNLPTYQPTITWKTTKHHILVICGSQGSRIIFEEILKNLENILQLGELIIVLGKLNLEMRKEFETKQATFDFKLWTFTIVDWISQPDIAHLIQDCDIAITRWSATTLAELTAFEHNPHLIIIPLTYSAGNHQYYNSLEYQKIGHTLLNQKDLNQLTEIINKNV